MSGRTIDHVAISERPARFYTEDQAERLGFGMLFRAAEEYARLGGQEFGDAVESPFPNHRTMSTLHWIWVSGAKAGQRRRLPPVTYKGQPVIEGEVLASRDAIEHNPEGDFDDIDEKYRLEP